MEQQSIVNILRKVNKISNLDKTTIVQEIQKRFEMAMQKEDETEHKAMSTAYQGWEQNGYEIDHSFELESSPFGNHRTSICKKTLLHIAAQYGYQNVVNALIKKGANFDVKDESGHTPLHFAAYNGYIDIVNALLEAGAEFNVMDGLGYTPLHYAAGSGYIDTVNALINKEANVNAQMVHVFKDSSAKDVDLESKFQKIVTTLTKKVIYFTRNSNKDTSLFFCSEEDYQVAVKILKNEGVDIVTGCRAHRGSTSLHLAAKNEHVEVVNALIKAKATVDILDEDKNTPLHFAAGNGHIKTVELLLKEETDINAQNEFGETPLHLAAKNGHKSVVEFLLHKGAEVDVLSGGIYKNTPLHLAAKNGHIRVVAPLLKNGANINAQNGFGETPLHFATFESKDEVVQFLIDEKAELFLKNSKGLIPSDCVNRGIPNRLKKAEKKAQQPIKYVITLGIAGSITCGLFIGAMLLNDSPEAAIAFATVVSVGVVSAICGVILYMCLKPSAEKKPVIVVTHEDKKGNPDTNMDNPDPKKGTDKEKEESVGSSAIGAQPTM